MTSTLNVPVTVVITIEIHEIEGGGFWAEIPRFPGCVTQAETVAALLENIPRAIADWWSESPEKTEDEARQLADIQGSDARPSGSFPRPNPFLPPSSWSDVEDDE